MSKPSDAYPEVPDNVKRFIDALAPVETITPAAAPQVKDKKTGKMITDPKWRGERS
jgi:hypothetical protein